jgi:hypothetical protein
MGRKASKNTIISGLSVWAGASPEGDRATHEPSLAPRLGHPVSVPCGLWEAIETIVYCFERSDKPTALDEALIAETPITEAPLVSYGELRRLAKLWREASQSRSGCAESFGEYASMCFAKFKPGEAR